MSLFHSVESNNRVNIYTILLFLISSVLHDVVKSQSDVQIQNVSYTYSLPTFSYGGMGAIFNNTLYAINGRNCTSTSIRSCHPLSSAVAFTLDLSNGITFDPQNRKKFTFNNNPFWQTIPIQLPSTSESSTVYTLAGTSSYTQLNQYVWNVFPGYAALQANNEIIKYDLLKNQYITSNINTHDYYALIEESRNLVDACNTNDGASNLYVIGGQNDDLIESKQAYKLEIINDIWTKLEDAPIAIKGSSCVVLNGYLYVMGGVNASDSKIDTIQVYDIANYIWDISNVTMIQRRHRSVSYVHPNQEWIVTIGGRDELDGACVTEYYEPNSELVVSVGNQYYNKQFYSSIWRYSPEIYIVFMYGGFINGTVRDGMEYLVLHHDDVVDGLTVPFSSTAMTDTPSPGIFLSIFAVVLFLL